MNLHYLALKLGKTVNELGMMMTYDEYLDWMQYFKQVNEEPPLEELSPEDFML